MKTVGNGHGHSTQLRSMRSRPCLRTQLYTVPQLVTSRHPELADRMPGNTLGFLPPTFYIPTDRPTVEVLGSSAKGGCKEKNMQDADQ